MIRYPRGKELLTPRRMNAQEAARTAPAHIGSFSTRLKPAQCDYETSSNLQANCIKTLLYVPIAVPNISATSVAIIASSAAAHRR